MLVANPGGRIPLGRLRCKRRIILKWIVGEDWIVWDRDWEGVLVNMVMYLSVP
jgi:hypothetical protein